MKKFMLITTAVLMSMQAQAADLTPEKVVEKANQQWNHAFNKGNIDQLVDLYSTEATLSPGNGAVLEGHDNIAQLFTGFKQNGVHNHQIETIDVIASDDQITQVAYWQAEGVNADNQAIKFGGVLMLTLEQNASDEWQVASHVWNMAP